MWFSGSCLLGDVDFGTSFALGFSWDGFAWVCETGVYMVGYYWRVVLGVSPGIKIYYTRYCKGFDVDNWNYGGSPVWFRKPLGFFKLSRLGTGQNLPGT